MVNTNANTNQSLDNPTFLTAVNTSNTSPRDLLTLPINSPKSYPTRKFPTLPTSPKDSGVKKKQMQQYPNLTQPTSPK